MADSNPASYGTLNQSPQRTPSASLEKAVVSLDSRSPLDEINEDQKDDCCAREMRAATFISVAHSPYPSVYVHLPGGQKMTSQSALIELIAGSVYERLGN